MVWWTSQSGLCCDLCYELVVVCPVEPHLQQSASFSNIKSPQPHHGTHSCSSGYVVDYGVHVWWIRLFTRKLHPSDGHEAHVVVTRKLDREGGRGRAEEAR